MIIIIMIIAHNTLHVFCTHTFKLYVYNSICICFPLEAEALLGVNVSHLN